VPNNPRGRFGTGLPLGALAAAAARSDHRAPEILADVVARIRARLAEREAELEAAAPGAGRAGLEAVVVELRAVLEDVRAACC